MTNEELCDQLQTGNDVSTELILQNAPMLRSLAVTYARQYPGCFTDANDYMQEGMLALLRVAKSYSAGQGSVFLPYAKAAIRNAIIDVIRKVYPASSASLLCTPRC